MSRIPLIVAACIAIGIALPFALVAFGTGSAPPPFRDFHPSSGPPGEVEPYHARDGQTLIVRRYSPDAPVDGAAVPIVVILQHGAGASSLFMADVAQALAARGITVYSPDWRGSGLSGQSGNIKYIGQLEDDLDDLLIVLRRRYPNARFIYVGHSAGGSFGMRIADETVGQKFDEIVVAAPYLGLRDPATRPNGAGGWVKIFTGRLIGLKILNAVGIHAFNGLPIIAFAMPKDVAPEQGARSFSYRMVENFNAAGGADLFTPKRTWRDDVRGAAGRMSFIFGGQDLGIDPEKARDEIQSEFPGTVVTIVPDSDHVGLTERPDAIAAIVNAISAARPQAISPGR
ncbi:hypothetical protein CY652_18020 [Burkholderia sp. WAC0059]|uniref:alpha/beta fold hydrolase n=1 Tax=Burkholderia sp. WAC0059 TaxID=2066022 RepID=UPI000C7E9AD1|nr:alpha/beta hydrolase [Burkholderia sp. WAC0059]PLZ00949.1 hypothetical protein CY652_18020 [Burkholderia sp. WAC0059]